jgi:phage shock protein C
MVRSIVMNATQTRLTRSATDKILGGVCGGLANYFGLDPVIVRVILVALVFAGGMSIILYPILWLIMPPAYGDQPTVANGIHEMQQVAQHVRREASSGAEVLRSRVAAAFSTGAPQPRFDPQTGLPLPQAPSQNRNNVLGIALVVVGVLMLGSFFPGGVSAMMAILFLAGGYYLLRRG